MHSNINNESYQSLKQFREKQIKSNIRLYIIFILLISIIDLGLLFFIFLYKSKISSIKSKSSENTSLISSNKDFIDTNNNLITRKFVNIIAQMKSDRYRFSLIFEKSEEVQKVKNSLIDFYGSKYKDKDLDVNKFEMNFIFCGVAEGSTYIELKSKIDMSYNTYIIIEGEKNMKFGFYIEEPIVLNRKGFQYKGNKCFLFSFQHNGIFKCIGDKNKLSIKNDENLIVIGDDDIIIKENFFTYEEKKGIINFPFKAIDVSTINENVFTPTNEKFHIMSMEIFSFDFN